MKAIHYLPPVAALVIAVVWTGGQRRSIAALERQSTLLRKEIAARRSSENIGAADGGRPASPGSEAKEKAPIDWKKIAAEIEESQRDGGMGSMRTFMRFQKRLLSMSGSELAAALDEIASLDLPDTTRRMLEQMLIMPLLEKEPELVLARFIDRVHDENGGMSWQLGNALQKWAEKDPAAATAWFDREIAAGTFDSKSLDGKSVSRMHFESVMINMLISSDSAAAASRLAALPENQRRETLEEYAPHSVKEENQAAYAGLIRQTLSGKEQQETIAGFVSRLAYNTEGYSDLTDCMDRIQATPAERGACVEKAAGNRFQQLSQQRKITREDLEQLREWTGSQSPETTDRATGRALAGVLNGGRKMEFSEVAGLAVEYHDASGSDELLVPLLESWQARNNKEQARELAGKIADETVREKMLKRLR